MPRPLFEGETKVHPLDAHVYVWSSLKIGFLSTAKFQIALNFTSNSTSILQQIRPQLYVRCDLKFVQFDLNFRCVVVYDYSSCTQWTTQKRMFRQDECLVVPGEKFSDQTFLLAKC